MEHDEEGQSAAESMSATAIAGKQRAAKPNTSLANNALASTTTTPEEDNNNITTIRRLLVAQTASDLFPFLGGCFMIAFTARKTKRDVVATIIYLLASIGFFASGTIAFGIDVCWSRKVSTGRYTTHRRWNFVITILFMIGVILDIVAFSFWSKGGTGVPEERRIQWIVSHCWLLAAIISLVVIFVESKGAFPLPEDRWDLLGNLSFLTEAILQCVARYITLPGDPMVSVSELPRPFGP